MDGLDLTELIKIKYNFLKHKIIDNNNYDKDDVVRARHLSGYFCNKVESETEDGEKYFSYESIASGILEPGQTTNMGYYKVHTALHNFQGEEIKDLYFVPYGFEQMRHKIKEQKDAKYVFKVLRIYDHNNEKIEQEFLNNYSPHKKNNPYKINDYSSVHIKIKSDGGEELATLIYKNINKNKENKLPDLLGNSEENEGKKMLFVIGMATIPDIGLEDSGQGFVVSFSSPMDNPNSGFEQRSFNDDPETGFYPPEIGRLLSGEIMSSFPSYYGMSGGPVLSCHVKDDQKKCELVGTLWGSERIFINKILTGWTSIINLIPLNKHIFFK